MYMNVVDGAMTSHIKENSNEMENHHRNLKQEERVLQHHIASLCGSLAMTFVGYPFDTVKTILQIQPTRPTRSPSSNPNPSSSNPNHLSSSKAAATLVLARFQSTISSWKLPSSYTAALFPLPSSSAYKTFHTVWRQHGFLDGFYRGWQMPLVSVMGMHLLAYPAYLKVKHQLGDSLPAVAMAGMTSGLIVSLVTCPAELLKIRAQLTSALPPGSLAARDTSMRGSLRRILRREGVGYAGLYRGWLSTAARDIPGSAGYFVMYELLTRSFMDRGLYSSEWLFLAGSLSSLFNWLLVLPLDNVKTQLQASTSASRPASNNASQMSAWLACCRENMSRKNAISNLYRGWDVLILRSIPTHLACLLGYQFTLGYMRSGLE